jgi:hypothetical protein
MPLHPLKQIEKKLLDFVNRIFFNFWLSPKIHNFFLKFFDINR